MTAPPDRAIQFAELAAAKSPCAKSKRGVVTYGLRPNPRNPLLSEAVMVGEGWNGPPAPPFAKSLFVSPLCDGSAACRESCSQRCVHAEMRALRGGTSLQRRIYAPLDVVHVKIGNNGKLVAGGGPSCWQCSREILDCGIVRGVWLYQLDEVFADIERIGRWCFYTADEFHRATLEACDIGGPR